MTEKEVEEAIKTLREELRQLKEKYESHTHDVYEYTYFGGEANGFETGKPKQ